MDQNKKTQRIVFEYSELGRVIKSGDIPELVTSLVERLGCNITDLDYSPNSLNFLEDQFSFYQHNCK